VHGGDSGVDTHDLAGPRERSSSSNELAVVIGDSTAQHLFDFESGREHMQQDLMETFSARWTGEEETLTKGRLRPEAVVGDLLRSFDAGPPWMTGLRGGT
jgi:hypothetical protein